MYKTGMGYNHDKFFDNGRGSGKMPSRGEYGKFPYGGSSADGSTGGIIPLRGIADEDDDTKKKNNDDD